jgi:hypothetical protein
MPVATNNGKREGTMPEVSDERRQSMILALEARLDNMQDELIRMRQDVDACELALEAIQENEDDRQRKVEPVKRQTDAIFWADPDPRD